MRHTSKSPQHTHTVAAEFARQLPAGRAVLILLQGEFGAGKTHFTQGLAVGLGITAPVTSPSYVYMQEYEIPKRGKLIHIDLWRVHSQEVLDLLRIPSHLEPGNIVVCEWGEAYQQQLAEQAHEREALVYKVKLTVDGESQREIDISEI